MKYKIEAIRETINKDTFYVEANSKKEAEDYVYENLGNWDYTVECDVSYWEILNVKEIK